MATNDTANSKQQTAKGDGVRVARDPDPFRGAYTFRRLIMWQRAQELSASVYALARTLPNDRATSVLVQQVLRSATSIAANIAEGHGRFSAGAYRNHLSIARGSTTETISWLDLLRRAGLINAEQETLHLQTCAELMGMLTAKMKELDRQIPRGARSSGRAERSE